MKFLLSELLAPAARRLGSLAGGALIGAGMAAGTAAQIETAIVAGSLFGVDLLVSHLTRLSRKAR